MGIIPKVRNAIREKKCTSRLACSEKAWCPLCITSRRLSNQTCCYISSELWKDGQSLFCCCHAVFQGVSRWLNDGVHLCVDVSVGQCTRHNLHSTNHIEISIQRTECWRSGACLPWHSWGFVSRQFSACKDGTYINATEQRLTIFSKFWGNVTASLIA